VELSGWYVQSSNRAAVVLLHGASSTRSNVLAQAEVLARRGNGVLLFDARGHGRSGGRAMEFGWNGELDTSAAVDYLAGRPDVDPTRVGAVGMSMGGEQVIGAMGLDDASERWLPKARPTVSWATMTGW
jgi:dienelactone hydrolase